MAASPDRAPSQPPPSPLRVARDKVNGCALKAIEQILNADDTVTL